ncbi:KpsF/GutQ family sugar-phosphate isomerase [Facilibium subflavum]|uniref:KpsF/GutQ family sugar-phosphate isomerase n=1 Tax=Facilibium subflavum TaxID=2219058 RepID=UPI000E6490B6|nr:KpsF/GutQ family sugar-phosphate isomerase [Facilibium subflavum]
MNDFTNQNHIKHALNTISLEIDALHHLKNNINENFAQACQIILSCQGRVIVIGMGKSGHIASKIAATLASTGTPAFFVHPAEAGHGDFGMITKQDVVIAISNSGSTPELTALTPMIKMLGIPLIAMTSKLNSPLADAADVTLNLGVTKEACPHNLAPTCSTTATLVLGDALAISLLRAKNFTAEDFASSHPSGSLGKRLLLKVKNLMITGDKIPLVHPNATIEQTIMEISSKGLGMSLVSEDGKKILGIFTDGDLRRMFAQEKYKKGIAIKTLMSKSPKTIHEDAMAIEALELMNQHKITSLAAIDDDCHLKGIIHMHDLIREGIA